MNLKTITVTPAAPAPTNVIAMPAPETKPAPANPAPPAPPEETYSVPVKVPSSLMQKLVAQSAETGLNISALCLDLIQKALNSALLSKGTINDLSEDAQDVFRTVSMEAALDALRIYGAPKAEVKPGDTTDPGTLSEGDIIFHTTSDVKDYIKQMNQHRIKKGLAPIENSICEILYHYGLTLGDKWLCLEVTGMSYNKYIAIFKTLGFNEREVNGIKSNLIDNGNFLGSSFTIIDTPDAELPAPVAAADQPNDTGKAKDKDAKKSDKAQPLKK